MFTRNNILSTLLVGIFIFPLPAIASNTGNRILLEAGFSNIELAVQEEMGWSDKRLVKYGDIACGYIVKDKSNSLGRLYKFYFGKHDPSKEPYVRDSLRKIHDWAKRQPECSK